MIVYTALIDDGKSGETTVEAENDPDALDLAMEWVRNEEWPDDGCTVRLTTHRNRTLEENCSACGVVSGTPCEDEPCVVVADSETIEIEPNLSVLDFHNNRHQRLNHDHTWETPVKLVGGTEEDPGVQSLGGTKVSNTSVCACGAHKVVLDNGSAKDLDEPQRTVSITYPEGLWPWGKDCEFPGKKKLAL